MSLVLNVEILGEFKKLTAATTGAETALQKMNKRADKISSGINKALGAIGIGFSLSLITREFDDMAKAATEDRKSQVLLRDAIIKVTDATDDQISSVETNIDRLQTLTGVADDKLRPAYATLLRSTGDITKANDDLALALDISAGTGKDLEAVAKAIAKATGPDGTTGALEKLVPAIKGAEDPMGRLRDLFGGAAEKAANTDPYARIQVIFGELQEQIGTYLLPYLEDFSEWLANPGTQQYIRELVDIAGELFSKFRDLGKWAIDNKDWLLPIATAAAGLAASFKLINAGVATFNAVAPVLGATAGTLNSKFLPLAGTLGAITAALAIIAAVDPLAKNLEAGIAKAAPGTIPNLSGQSSAATPSGIVGNMVLGTPKATTSTTTTAPKAGSTTVNVNVKNVTDAKTIVNTLDSFVRTSGNSDVLKLVR
jgi:hypothetical protein